MSTPNHEPPRRRPRSDGVLQVVELPDEPTATAPDGSDVRVLLAVPGASMAHFEFPAGSVSQAVRHRSVDEIWYVLGGRGEMWRAAGPEPRGDGAGRDGEMLGLVTGRGVTIPVGTRFQVRVEGTEPLRVVGVTTPPWPGSGEAELVGPRWQPTLAPGPL